MCSDIDKLLNKDEISGDFSKVMDNFDNVTEVLLIWHDDKKAHFRRWGRDISLLGMAETAEMIIKESIYESMDDESDGHNE